MHDFDKIQTIKMIYNYIFCFCYQTFDNSLN